MNKINYDLEMLKLLDSKDYCGKLCLHSCCAPCSSYCILELTRGFDITVFYYNPNLDSLDEFNKRKEEEKRFINLVEHKHELNYVDIGYDNESFIKIAKGKEHLKEGGERCFECFNLRLEKTAQYAKENNYDYFATTLTISPLKNAAKINEIGFLLEKKYGIKYLATDFKKRDGYLKSTQISKEYCMYRQNYCGCIYSKLERESQINKEIK